MPNTNATDHRSACSPSDTIRVFEDASGAPAVIHSNGYTFAMDCLGRTTCNLIGDAKRSPAARKLAATLARWRYERLLHAATTEEWREANRVMYPRLCPVCADGECQTKSTECGR
jgi:hypothetical protein